ncbi:hypothetical protein HK100_011424 [Physocladia obscura]|uniref:SP-RING-type domain-containing protein n=1 Tax=Physocladia obscura TaxID=109957 RepID=A0AAD5T1W4_9FUNG|nr:hypothetical protein HK100_011424 [Physocladia obscura]
MKLTPADFMVLTALVGVTLREKLLMLGDPSEYGRFTVAEIRQFVHWAEVRFPESGPGGIARAGNSSSKAAWVLCMQAVFFDQLYRFPRARSFEPTEAAAAVMITAAQVHVRTCYLEAIRHQHEREQRQQLRIRLQVPQSLSSRSAMNSSSAFASARPSQQKIVRRLPLQKQTALRQKTSLRLPQMSYSGSTSTLDLIMQIPKYTYITTPSVCLLRDLAISTIPNELLIPIRFKVSFTSAIAATIYENISIPRMAAVKKDACVLWHFRAAVADRAGEMGWKACDMPVGSLSVDICGSAIMNAGIVTAQSAKKVDITEVFRAQSVKICSELQSDRIPILTFAVTFHEGVRSSCTAIATAVNAHQRLSVQESLVKLYKDSFPPQSILSVAVEANVCEENVAEVVEKLQKAMLETIEESGNSGSDAAVSSAAATIANDDEVTTGDSTVTFTCPLTLARIKHPAKGKKCLHRQTFDAEDIQIDIDYLRLLRKYPTSEKCIIKSDGTDEPFSATLPSSYTVPSVDASGQIRQSNTFMIGGLSDDSSLANKHAKKRSFTDVITILSSDDECSEPIFKRSGRHSASSSFYNSTITEVESIGASGEIVQTIVID